MANAAVTYEGFTIDHPDGRARERGERSSASMKVIVGKQDRYRLIPMTEEELVEVATDALKTARTMREIRERENPRPEVRVSL